jgi:hypothetical protein
VWASGNGGAEDHCGCDGFASSRFTISVAAVTQSGARPEYSEICSSILVAAYSGGANEPAIATVGTNGACANHSGTSAAAPIAAGIIGEC